jgi:hypothetical protein
LDFGLAETSEVPHTITVGNTLKFLTVLNTAPIGQQFTSYDCHKLNRSAEIEIWADCTIRRKAGIWQNSAMTSPQTLNMKNVINELSFLLVTNMVNSNARFDSYRILKLGQGAEQILGRLDRWMNNEVLRAYNA